MGQAPRPSDPAARVLWRQPSRWCIRYGKAQHGGSRRMTTTGRGQRWLTMAG